MLPAHPVLRRLFGALETTGVRWTLLREPADPGAPTGDVDLLVTEEDVPGLRAAAARVGFLALPGWHRPPDLLLIRYDRASDLWLLLDVATEVGFRRPRGWRPPGLAATVLARREVRDGVAVPADGDAFWLLLLHCVLDKGELDPRYRDRLRALAPAGAASPLAALAEAAGPDAPGAFATAAGAGDWDAVAALGERLATALERRQPVREKVARFAEDLAGPVRRVAFRPHRRGANLALLGPNGVGKSTLADGLRRAVPLESRVIHMGLWKGAGGRWPAAEVLLRPLTVLLRYVRARGHQLQNRLVVFDRYVYEAWLPTHPPLVPLKRVYHGLLARVVPRAEAAVVLDVPGDLAFTRKQENPPEELEEERAVYAGIARRLPDIEVVDASQDADAVRADVSAVLWRALERRWGG